MADAGASLDAVAALNARAAFNLWAGFEVVRAGAGEAELRLDWRAGLGQYAGFLHAAMIGGMIDTACGFAAFTVAGPVMASHFSVDCLAPAAGDAFVARGHVVKAGRRQVFTCAELFARRGAEERLVATGSAILVPVAPAPDRAARAPHPSPGHAGAPAR
jgi:acyl-coenzyme A thioesterase PaaI-like protein